MLGGLPANRAGSGVGLTRTRLGVKHNDPRFDSFRVFRVQGSGFRAEKLPRLKARDCIPETRTRSCQESLSSSFLRPEPRTLNTFPTNALRLTPNP